MARLIDATRIEQYILNNCSDNEEINAIYGEIINAPTIEAEPTKHGRWSEKHYCSNLTGYDYAAICSECEKPTYRQFAEPTPNYCPNCGARMDGPAPEAAEIINDGTYSAGEEDHNG